MAINSTIRCSCQEKNNNAATAIGKPASFQTTTPTRIYLSTAKRPPLTFTLIPLVSKRTHFPSSQELATPYEH